MSKEIRFLENELGTARKRLASARHWASQYGHYDDCGSDYNSDYQDAKAVVAYLEEMLPRIKQLT